MVGSETDTLELGDLDTSSLSSNLIAYARLYYLEADCDDRRFFLACAKCGAVHDDSPQRAPAFGEVDETCQSCDARLTVESAVLLAADWYQEASPSADAIANRGRQVLQAWWTTHLWRHRIQMRQSLRVTTPRRAYHIAAYDLDIDWTPLCPVCGEKPDRFTFHHWVYGDDEQGVNICQDCHEHVHDGKRIRDQKVDAKRAGMNGWLDDSVARMVEHHRTTHDLGVDVLDWTDLVERFNIPLSPAGVRSAYRRGQTCGRHTRDA